MTESSCLRAGLSAGSPASALAMRVRVGVEPEHVYVRPSALAVPPLTSTSRKWLLERCTQVCTSLLSV